MTLLSKKSLISCVFFRHTVITHSLHTTMPIGIVEYIKLYELSVVDSTTGISVSTNVQSSSDSIRGRSSSSSAAVMKSRSACTRPLI